MVFTFKGIPKIKIPVQSTEIESAADGGLSLIKKYLSDCIRVHRNNADKIDYLYNFYLGDQDIKLKKRLFDNSGLNNNRAVENHAKAQVDWKKGLLTGEQIQFSCKDTTKSNKAITLDKYFLDADFYSKYQDLMEYVYACGIGTTFTTSRTDIISNGGDYVGYDKDSEAPFIFEVVDPKLHFKVYSSYIGNEPLFDVAIVDKSETISGIPHRKYEICVWTKTKYYVFSSGLTFSAINYNLPLDSEVLKINANANGLPLVEHCTNNSRIGIIEVNRDLYNVVNLIVSNSTDAIIDNVNQVWVFENVDIDEEKLGAIKVNGAIKIKSDIANGANEKAKVYTLELKFNHSDINVFYEQRIKKMYDIAGVPLGSGFIGNGNNGASEIGGGWANAYTIIKQDIRGLQKSDYAQLKLILSICDHVPDSPLKGLKASEIEIKYNIIPNDNILSKSQAASSLSQIGMPEEQILSKTGLSMDVNTEAKQWRLNKEKLKAEEEAKAEKAMKNNPIESNSAKQRTGDKK